MDQRAVAGAFSPEFVQFYAEAKRVLGPARAGRVLSYIAEWQMALDDHFGSEHGVETPIALDEFGIEAFAQWADEGTATVYRRNADFRAVFPGVSTPAQLLRERTAA